MTVAVQQDLLRARPFERQRADACCFDEFLEQHAGRRDLCGLASVRSPRSSAGASSRTADRQLGSQKTNRWPARPRRIQSSALSRASCRACGEQALRDQRPAAAAVRRQSRTGSPRRCSTSSAAMPISGS